MFTVEIKVNGNLIAHVYGRRLGAVEKRNVYEFEYYKVGDEPAITKGAVTRNYEDGMGKLLMKILREVDKCSKAKGNRSLSRSSSRKRTRKKGSG